MGKRKKGTSANRDRSRDDAVFKALANGDRRLIMDLLQTSAKTTGDLCDSIDHLDRCTVMLHLKTLAKADLIIVRRQGRHRWNYLNVEPIQGIYERWIRHYARPASELLTRLKRDLEAEQHSR